MNYAKIEFEVSNGLGCGYSLFVQGCNNHCHNCFNPETWDFNGGEPFTDEVRDKFLSLIDKPYIKRVSILGGEPLDPSNVKTVLNLVKLIKIKFGEEKKIWIYTGYNYEDLRGDQRCVVAMSDVLVDGRYIDEERDITLPFRGSKNQRLIDCVSTIINPNNEVILFEYKKD